MSLLDTILKWVWPVPGTRLTSQFNPGVHNGVDVGIPSGSTVLAPTSGKIIYAGDASSSGYGGLVKIQSDVGTIFLAHLRGFYVKSGDTVKAGQPVGVSGGGKTDAMHGNSTGPHLHYEIRSPGGGGQVNPMTFSYNPYKQGGKVTDPPYTPSPITGERGTVEDPETGPQPGTGKKPGIGDFLKDPAGAVEDTFKGIWGDLLGSVDWTNLVVGLIGVGLIIVGVLGLVVGEAGQQLTRPIAKAIKDVGGVSK